MAGKRMFKNLTLREQFILLLKLEHQARITESRSSRTVMLGTINDKPAYFFLGTSGAVRINYKNAYTDSRSKTDYYKARLDTEEIQYKLKYLWSNGMINLD